MSLQALHQAAAPGVPPSWPQPASGLRSQREKRWSQPASNSRREIAASQASPSWQLASKSGNRFSPESWFRWVSRGREQRALSKLSHPGIFREGEPPTPAPSPLGDALQRSPDNSPVKSWLLPLTPAWLVGIIPLHHPFCVYKQLPGSLSILDAFPP